MFQSIKKFAQQKLTLSIWTFQVIADQVQELSNTKLYLNGYQFNLLTRS